MIEFPFEHFRLTVDVIDAFNTTSIVRHKLDFAAALAHAQAEALVQIAAHNVMTPQSTLQRELLRACDADIARFGGIDEAALAAFFRLSTRRSLPHGASRQI